MTADAEILANPLYGVSAAEYKDYDAIMGEMERAVTTMHEMVNALAEKRAQLDAVVAKLPAGDKFATIKKNGEALSKKMLAWDEDMIQRKSKAYDDVENFPNKFTADYLFVLNQTESDLPRVNQPSLDQLKILNAKWATLKGRADEITGKDLPALNNDHVLGPDGHHIYVSADDGHIHRAPLTGGPATRITQHEDHLHFLHGVSPDGATLTDAGYGRLDDLRVDARPVPVTVLTDAQGTAVLGTVTIDLTLTSAACPLTDVIEDQTRAALDGVVADYRINWVWMPPWSPEKITDDGREMLRALGFNV